VRIHLKGLSVLLFIFFTRPPDAPAAAIKIIWDANKNEDVLGYRVYWGTASHEYRFYSDAGPLTALEITGLAENIRYHIAVTAIDYWGNESLFSQELVAIPGQGAVEAEIPRELELGTNFPNPFNPWTTIFFKVPARRFVSLVVYNSMGQKIKTLEARYFEPDRYETSWDGTDDCNRPVSAGVYYYRLESEGKALVRSMTFLR